MATEEMKKARLMRMFNGIIFGFGKGLYDLFGEAAVATATTIGEDMIEEMEKGLGLEIQGEDLPVMGNEIGRLLVDEYGLLKDGRVTPNENGFTIHCEGCQMWRATELMLKNGAQPYHCVPMMLAQAATNKRLGKHVHFKGLTQDQEKRICSLDFRSN